MNSWLINVLRVYLKRMPFHDCACTLPDRVEAWLTCFDVSHHDINQAYLGYYVWLGMSSRFTGVAMVDPSHYWP